LPTQAEINTIAPCLITGDLLLSSSLSKSGQIIAAPVAASLCPNPEIQNKIDAETVTLRTLQAMKRSTMSSLDQMEQLIEATLNRIAGLRRERAKKNR